MQWWYTMIAIWLITITIELTSQSEILIIRHGRSRSHRHSSEKEHSRWIGLKSLNSNNNNSNSNNGNLTIGENHNDDAMMLAESVESETNGDMNVIRFYEHNGTLSQSNEFNGTSASYEINYTYGPAPFLKANSGGNSNAKRHRYDWHHSRNLPSTTEMSPLKHPSSSSLSSKKSSIFFSKPINVSQQDDNYNNDADADADAKGEGGNRKRNGKKKEFITNIKSTVNKGIQFLKAHENLDEVEIEINDYNARRSSSNNRNDDTTKRTVKSNKIRSQSTTNANQRDSIHFMQQQQQHKSHNSNSKQIKINGGKDFRIVTVSSDGGGSSEKKKNKTIMRPAEIGATIPVAVVLSSYKLKKSNEKQQQQHTSTKHIKIHQAHNEKDMNIKSNLADVFYVPTSTTVMRNKQKQKKKKMNEKHNPYDDDDEQMLSDEPAGNVGIGNKMEIKESLMEKSNQHNQTKKNDANQNRHGHGINSSSSSSSTTTTTSTSTVAPLSLKSKNNNSNNNKEHNGKRNATHANGFSNKNKNSTMHTDKSKIATTTTMTTTMPAAATTTTTIRNRKSNNNGVMIDTSKSMPHELVVGESEHDSSNIQVNDEINNDEEFINSIGIQNDDISNENTIDLDGSSDFEENGNFNGVLNEEDLDLSDLDETSRNNRKNLMRGRDVVTRFLQIVESQHMMGNNCTAGTALNLGEGVVDRYAQDRFRVEAEVAVNRANMLTRIFKMSPAVQRDINLLHASVLSMVEFDEDIFAAGHCFDENQYPLKKGLFCPFAHRLPPPEVATLAKDLANEYHYLGNTSEWFFLARKNAEKVIARNEQYIKAYHSYSNDSERHAEEILSVKYEDGRWSKPYYDCGGGNIWMLTYTVPFFGYDNGTYFFKGTSGIDIDLRRVDIDQCPQKNTGAQQPLNIFAGTDKCKQRTTECSPISGLGFRRGSYKCICRKGFYYPDVKSEFKYFNGTHLEEEYAKWMQSEISLYTDPMSFECLPCAEGCDICEDASPCVAELNWPMRTSILILACAVIGFLPPAGFFTFRYQQVKIVKAASPALLRVIAMGAFLIYCTTIVMYPNPSLYTCVAKIWLREIGFSLTYGALMLKTWRISVIFRVRSAKAVKITDASLIKKLSLLCGFVSVALLIRTLVSPPDVIVGRTADNLKAFLCKTDWWDHTFTSMEVLFLAWGVRLCIVVRKAPSEFNESRFISMAIYNEFLLTCFLNVSMLFLQSPANPDLLYIIFFCHTQLTVTLLLALIFGSKVYLVFRNGGKSLEDATHSKSTAAKFISRPQPRTYASASSVNASTGQLHYPLNGGDNRLSENEAVEEIKQLTKQLQILYDRIPQKSAATNVILALLDICRSVQNAGNSLKPLALPSSVQAHEQHAKALCGGVNGDVNTEKVICTLVDKETNTSHDNLATCANVNCRLMISDKCDNDNHNNNNNNSDKSKNNNNNNNGNNKKKKKSKCCEANNVITCSTNSINFDNLQLQCMCSSDNNSLDEEYQIDDNHEQQHQHTSSFRERLLNFTGANKYDDSSPHKQHQQQQQHSNNLRKRNSELVLATNFDSSTAVASTTSTSVYKNSQSYRISKTFDSCDNIFSQKQAPQMSLSLSNKSNHSLSTESDQKSIPYSYLERPSMKLSQSEDKNLRELKIALSSTLPLANKASNSHANTNNNNNNNNKAQLIGNMMKSSHSQSCTSTATTTSSSSKIDKISISLSNSSTSDAIVKKQQQQNNNHKDSKTTSIMIDETGKRQQQQQQQQIQESTDNQNDNKNEDNKMITAASCDNKVATSNVNNNNITNPSGGSGGSGKRKGKGAIDLNDRSKYTEEVSV